MKNKIIFLDIDGVLNSEQYHIGRYKKYLSKEVTAEYIEKNHALLSVDPQTVKLLNKITDETSAGIVLSSTWRIGRTHKEIQDLFNVWGITGSYRGNTDIRRDSSRGQEINDYLVDYKLIIDRWCIIDDDNDMLPCQLPHFFRTDWEVGLTEEIADRVINYLNN